VAEVADDGGGDDAKAVGDGGVEVGEFNQDEQDTCVNQCDPAIDKIAPEIFLPAVAACMKHDIFVAEKGVGDGHNVGGNEEDEIVDARIQEVVQGRINHCPEYGVPSAHNKIPQRLVLRGSEERQ